MSFTSLIGSVNVFENIIISSFLRLCVSDTEVLFRTSFHSQIIKGTMPPPNLMFVLFALRRQASNISQSHNICHFSRVTVSHIHIPPVHM